MTDENKPVDKLPHFLHGMMNAEVEKDLDKFVAGKFEEWNANERKRHQVEVSGPSGAPPVENPESAPTSISPVSPPLPMTSSPKPPQIPLIAIDNQVLPGDTVTMMLYALVTLAKKDKKIAKLLRSFKFVMKNVNGDVIWK